MPKRSRLSQRSHRHAVAITRNAQIVCASRQGVVDVYSLSTKRLLCELRHATGSITCIASLCHSHTAMCAGTDDGKLLIWDKLPGTKEISASRIIDVGLRIVSVTSMANCGTHVYVVAAKEIYAAKSDSDAKMAHNGSQVNSNRQTVSVPSTSSPSSTSYTVLKVPIPQQSVKSSKPVKIKHIFKSSEDVFISASADGQIIAVANRRRLMVWNNGGDAPFARISHERKIVSVDISTDGSRALVADNGGQIALFAIFQQSISRIEPEHMHWHAHPANAAKLAADGSHAFTAGAEGVLVVWQLIGGERDFLPRLGAACVAMDTAMDTKRVALLLADGTIRVVDPFSLSTVVSIRRATPAHDTVHTPSGLFWDQSRSALVSCGASGAMQWFSHATNEYQMAVSVVPRNAISSTNANPPPVRTLELAAFSKSGKTMITVDGLSSTATVSGEYRLRFWELRGGKYHVVTQSTLPAASKPIGIDFAPEGNQAYVLLKNSRLGVWGSARSGWSCTSAIDLPNGVKGGKGIKVSSDGTVLAVAMQKGFGLWSTDSGELIHSFSTPQVGMVEGVEWTGTEGKLCVYGSNGAAIVNIMTTSQKESITILVKGNVASVAADPTGNFLLAAASPLKQQSQTTSRLQTFMVAFDLTKPSQRQCWLVNDGVRHAAITAAGELVAVTTSRRCVVLQSTVEDASDGVIQGAGNFPRQSALPGLADAMGGKSTIVQKHTAPVASANSNSSTQDNASIADMLDLPGHLIPNLGGLCLQVLQATLPGAEQVESAPSAGTSELHFENSQSHKAQNAVQYTDIQQDNYSDEQIPGFEKETSMSQLQAMQESVANMLDGIDILTGMTSAQGSSTSVGKSKSTKKTRSTRART